MWRDEALLLDILIAARKAVAFTDRKSWKDFERDEVLQNAVMHLVQIIGEAASKVTPETKEASPHIPWVRIIGMRHRLVHDYLRIDTARVWEVARNDLPSLIAAVQPLVPPEV